MARMWDAWTMIDEDPDVRVAILTGAGGTFCAGADLKLMHSDQSDNPWHARFKEDPDLHWKALLRHYRLKKPLIAAVEGFAATTFAFGQTGSGKTFTITGPQSAQKDHALDGLLPRAMWYIYEKVTESPEWEYSIRASYLEIYNEAVHDLLNPVTVERGERRQKNKDQ